MLTNDPQQIQVDDIYSEEYGEHEIGLLFTVNIFFTSSHSKTSIRRKRMENRLNYHIDEERDSFYSNYLWERGLQGTVINVDET